jgi:uncharacterized membrane protein YbhN (UPF0104 family)
MPPFLERVTSTIAQARIELVLLALVLHVAGLVVTGERWRLLFASIGTPVSLARAVLVNLAGIFVRNVTPASGLGGDAVRIALFKSAGATLGDATVIFVWARLVELPAIAAMVLLAAPLIGPLTHSPRSLALSIGGVIGAAGVAAYALRRGRAGRWLIARAGQAARVPLSRSIIGRACLWAAASWVETVLRLIVVSAAAGVRLSVAQGCALAVLTILGGLAPTIGSLGGIEGSLMAGLLLFGVPVSTATAITVIERAITYLFCTAAGAAALAAIGGWNLIGRRRRRLVNEPSALDATVASETLEQ